MTTSLPAQLPVQVLAADGATDYSLSLTDHTVTVAEVLNALGVSADASVNGQPVSALETSRAVEVLEPGVQVVVGAPPPVVRPQTCRHIDVAVVAGLDAGRYLELGAGDFRVRDGADSWYLQVPSCQTEPDALGSWHCVGSSTETVTTPSAVLALSKPVEREVSATPTVHRPPRLIPRASVAPIAVDGPLEALTEPQSLSWATLLAPIPIAILMAVMFRPIFAIFAAMGPVMALGRWFESRRRHRKATIKRERQVGQLRVDVGAARLHQAEQIAQLRWLANPHVAELVRRVKAGSVRLWERRPDSAGFLTVAIGVGPDQAEPILAAPSASPLPELADLLDQPVLIRPVPHLVDLAAGSGLGVHGQRSAATAIARSIVLQIATLHGPADVRIGAVCSQQDAPAWDWLKWLPHGDHRMIDTNVDSMVRELEGPPVDRRSWPDSGDAVVTSRVTVLIVDSTTADVAAIQRAAKRSKTELRIIAIAETASALPAACSSLVATDHTGWAEIATPALGGRRPQIRATGISLETAERWSRSMARVNDPEIVELAPRGGAAVSLLSLVRLDRSLEDHWRSRDPADPPVAVVGMADDGPFSINLTQDGPHALIAGTTGSGKSELLRSLVLALAVDMPPDQLHVVLVDFKGGGAFDVVSDLPHIAGLITDLDETLVDRALGSLRAELQRRESLFRELGVASFEAAARARPGSLARLVLVIDEFAALAADYPDLLESIVDLAARGRSLGMHLILATQRPSGVVDQKIRANTNVRIALRVQDGFDSQDVVGTTDAAAIDRKSPGRAIVVVGGDTPVQVQTAYSGQVDRRSLRCMVRPHQLFTPRSPQVEVPVDERAPTELDVLVDTIRAASQTFAPARSLWVEPLPESLDWIDLGAQTLSARASSPAADLALGLVDLPDQQAQRPWYWHPDSGPLALYGGSAECLSKVMVSIGAAVAASSGPEQSHLYVVDGGVGASAALADLPHTGAYARLAERDRIERIIEYLDSELTARRATGPAGERPRLVLMVENLGAVLSIFDDLSAMTIADRLVGLARDGSPHDVHLVVTARTVRDIGHRLNQYLPNRLALALADPGGYLALGLRARAVPVLPAMRAVDLVTHRQLQLVEPPVLEQWSHQPSDGAGLPVPIGSFPELFDAGLLKPAWRNEQVLHIPVGIQARDLAPAVLSVRRDSNLLVVGSPGMGRTSLLQTVCAQLNPVDDVQVYWLDVHGTQAPASATLVASPSAIAADQEAPKSNMSILVVDDAELVSAEQADELAALMLDPQSTIRIVASSSLLFARSARSWVAPLRASANGVVLGGQPVDGDIFHVRFDRLEGLGKLPGRGHILNRGRVCAVQIAHPTTAS